MTKSDDSFNKNLGEMGAPKKCIAQILVFDPEKARGAVFIRGEDLVFCFDGQGCKAHYRFYTSRGVLRRTLSENVVPSWDAVAIDLAKGIQICKRIPGEIEKHYLDVADDIAKKYNIRAERVELFFPN